MPKRFFNFLDRLFSLGFEDDEQEPLTLSRLATFVLGMIAGAIVTVVTSLIYFWFIF